MYPASIQTMTIFFALLWERWLFFRRSTLEIVHDFDGIGLFKMRYNTVSILHGFIIFMIQFNEGNFTFFRKVGIN